MHLCSELLFCYVKDSFPVANGEILNTILASTFVIKLN